MVGNRYGLFLFMELEIFKVNKNGCRIVPATSNGVEIHPAAKKFCGPFMHAMNFGWHVYPPLDMDISFDGKGRWEHKILSEYPPEEIDVFQKCAKKFGSKAIDLETLKMGIYGIDKKKYSLGTVEWNIFNFWTGCIFKLPPNWSLMVVNPINIAQDRPFSVQSAILECDWLRVDHWINFKWNQPYKWAQIRRDQKEPIAQLIPIYRDSYEKGSWKIKESELYDNEEVFKEWSEYYANKFTQKDEKGEFFKDSTTYHKFRKENRLKQDSSKCPFHKK